MKENFVWNENLFYWLNGFAGQSDFWDGVFVFWAEPLIWIIIVLFSLYFARLIWRDKKVELKETLLYFSVPFIAWGVTSVVKFFVPTERPFSALDNVVQLTEESVMTSFPSGHATLSVALATSIYFYNRKIGLFFYLMAFFVTVSRPLTGVHFPLDIVAGNVLGVALPVVFMWAWKKFGKIV